MKFILESDVVFEADNLDQALVKLALQFMGMMQSPPVLLIKDRPPLDMIKIIQDAVPPLNDETTEGFVEVNFIVDHEPPVMMQ